MKAIVELHASYWNKYDEKLLTQIAQETIKISDIINCDDKEITISVAVVDEHEMQRVNNQLRGKDAVTNVLSIGDYSDQKNIAQESKSEIFLGEVILCYNYIEQIAREDNVSIDKEFFTIYAHGILHLLGFAHSEEMFYLQDSIGKKFVI